LRPGRTVRGHQAERLGSRGEHRGTARVHGDPVRSDVLVTPGRKSARDSTPPPMQEAGEPMSNTLRDRRSSRHSRTVRAAAATTLLALTLAACGGGATGDDGGDDGDDGNAAASGPAAPATIPEL